MNFALSSLIFIMPLIALYSGLSVAITVPLFAIGFLWQTKKSLEFNIKDYKLEICFILWSLFSAIWSLNSGSSFASALKTSTEFLFGLLLIRNIVHLKIPKSKIENLLVISFSICLILFWVEYATHGKISLIFRMIAQKKESHIFFFHYLDRGLAFLTLTSWLIIGIFLERKQLLFAGFIYFATIVSLFFSDNLAAFVGNIIAGIVFVVTRFSMLKNPKILCILLILGSFSMIGFSSQIDPYKISNEVEKLPFSAKHRLFIWSFVAENALAKQPLGIGFNSSRIFPIQDDQKVIFSGIELHPLPMHPHNNVMQVYFELGIIGLILYLSLACKYMLIIGKKYYTTNNMEKNWICAQYSCFIVYFTVAMISYNIWQSWWIFSAIWASALFKFICTDKTT